ncbi:MAG: hypothetical protein AAF989_00660 [Planctomycetota bacterium]
MPDSALVEVDDKFVPLYRIVWVSSVPHFCGEEDCTREGFYEICIEAGDPIWTNASGRDRTVAALKAWAGDPRSEGGTDWAGN